MVAHFALLPSPLLGAAMWEPVELALRDADQIVTTVAVDGDLKSPSDVVDGFLLRLPDAPLVLVPHSNAGLMAPALAAVRTVSATVFVDAALPPANAVMTTAAPASLYGFLKAKTDDDGILPVWTQWWDEDVVARLFPDATTRDAVERQQRRLPLTYFSEALAVPRGWNRSPCAYLAFGDTYAQEAAAAQNWGWPVSVRPGGHLEMLWHPDEVAEELQRLARLLLGEDSR